MAYLTPTDYTLQIQDVNLQQIINSNVAIRENAELLAEAEARSYLIQKYNFDAEVLKVGTARDPQLLAYIIDIALYHLHSRIAPRNVPELRLTRYENAVAWLKMCAYGDVTPKLEVITPAQGNRTRYGGNTKNTNQY
jgi:phage gp36-like protein